MIDLKSILKFDPAQKRFISIEQGHSYTHKELTRENRLLPLIEALEISSSDLFHIMSLPFNDFKSLCKIESSKQPESYDIDMEQLLGSDSALKDFDSNKPSESHLDHIRRNYLPMYDVSRTLSYEQNRTNDGIIMVHKDGYLTDQVSYKQYLAMFNIPPKAEKVLRTKYRRAKFVYEPKLKHDISYGVDKDVINLLRRPEYHKHEISDDFSDIKLFLECIFPDRLDRHYVLSWMSQALRARSSCLLLLSGPQGCGKTMFSGLLRALFGADNCALVANRQLNSQYKSFLYRKRFVYADEYKAFTVDDRENLKHIKNAKISVEMKYQNIFDTENHCSIMMANNNEGFVRVIPQDRHISAPELLNDNMLNLEGSKLKHGFLDMFNEKYCETSSPHFDHSTMHGFYDFLINFKSDLIKFKDNFRLLNHKFERMCYASAFTCYKETLDKVLRPYNQPIPEVINLEIEKIEYNKKVHNSSINRQDTPSGSKWYPNIIQAHDFFTRFTWKGSPLFIDESSTQSETLTVNQDIL